MKELTIKEKRTDIFIGIVGLMVITPLIVGFTYMLLTDSGTFAYNNRILYIILVSIFIISSKDSLTMLVILCSKLILPYYIKIDKQGFYDCKLRQFITWDKIDRIEYINYKATFFTKKNFIINKSIIFVSLLRTICFLER